MDNILRPYCHRLRSCPVIESLVQSQEHTRDMTPAIGEKKISVLRHDAVALGISGLQSAQIVSV
jgi:hypothetical protein